MSYHHQQNSSTSSSRREGAEVRAQLNQVATLLENDTTEPRHLEARHDKNYTSNASCATTAPPLPPPSLCLTPYVQTER